MKTEVTEEKVGSRTTYSITLSISEGQYRELERWIDRVPAIKQSKGPLSLLFVYALLHFFADVEERERAMDVGAYDTLRGVFIRHVSAALLSVSPT